MNSSPARLLEVVASPRLVDHPQRDRWRDHAELLDLSLAPDEAQAQVPADAHFTLFRPAPFSPWRGSEIGIDASGRVVGRFDDEHRGNAVEQRSGQVPLAVVRVLIAAARRAQFFTVLPDGPDADCASHDPHHGNSLGLVTVTLGGVTRSLDLSYACFSFERMRGIAEFADRIELLSRVYGGISRRQIFADW